MHVCHRTGLAICRFVWRNRVGNGDCRRRLRVDGHERAAMERTQRIIDRHWMKQVGVLRQPANDIVGETRAAGR